MMYRSDKYGNKISAYHLIFFKGKLETMDYFTDKLCEGADKLGIDYYIANYLDSDSYTRPEFFEFIKQENCVAVLLNQIGLNLQCNGQNLWEMYNIPVYNFIVDHPFTREAAIDLYFNAFDEKCTKEQLRMLNETAAGYIEATVRRYKVSA